MLSEIEPHLATLSEKYLVSHSRLAKPEADEASLLCRQALAEGEEGAALCLRFATSLPADAVASAVAENWSSLDDARRLQIVERLPRLPEPGGKRFRLALGVELRDTDASLACRILTQACQALLEPKSDRPTKKNVTTTRVMLLDGKEPALLGFDFAGATKVEVGPLLTLVISAVFTPADGKRLEFAPLAPRVLNWMWTQKLFPLLSPEQRAAVAAATANWPAKAKSELIEQFEVLPDELGFLKSAPAEPSAPPAGALEPDQAADAAPTSQRQPSDAGPAAISTAPAPQRLPHRDLLAQLGAAFKDLVKLAHCDGRACKVRSRKRSVAAYASTFFLSRTWRRKCVSKWEVRWKERKF